MAPTWLTPRAAAQADSVNSPLAISIIWGIYQIVPYALVLFYWLVSKGVMLQYMCRLGLLVTFVSGAAAVGLMWGLYPPSYNFAKVQPSHTVRDMLVGLLQPLELASCFCCGSVCQPAGHSPLHMPAKWQVVLYGLFVCTGVALTMFCCAGCSTVQLLLRCSACGYSSSQQ